MTIGRTFFNYLKLYVHNHVNYTASLKWNISSIIKCEMLLHIYEYIYVARIILQSFGFYSLDEFGQSRDKKMGIQDIM